MSKISFKGVVLNLRGLMIYVKTMGKYGLLKDGKIVKIKLWSTTIDPQELHFDKPLLKRSALSRSEWAYTKDFLGFSNSKRLLKKFRKFLKKIHRI